MIFGWLVRLLAGDALSELSLLPVCLFKKTVALYRSVIFLASCDAVRYDSSVVVVPLSLALSLSLFAVGLLWLVLRCVVGVRCLPLSVMLRRTIRGGLMERTFVNSRWGCCLL